MFWISPLYTQNLHPKSSSNCDGNLSVKLLQKFWHFLSLGGMGVILGERGKIIGDCKKFSKQFLTKQIFAALAVCTEDQFFRIHIKRRASQNLLAPAVNFQYLYIFVPSNIYTKIAKKSGRFFFSQPYFSRPKIFGREK